MPDGTVDVPLWRYKGVKVPLHLDRFHPFGCAVEAVLPKHSQTRYAPKTVSCIFLGFDDNSLSYVLARLPNYAILHTAHAVFNDNDFPCRKVRASNWPQDNVYDQLVVDPLSHWLGEGRYLAMTDATETHSGGGPLHIPALLQGGRSPSSGAVGTSVERSDAHILPAVEDDAQGNRPEPSVPSSDSLGQASNLGPPIRRSVRGWQPSAAALQNIVSHAVEVDALFLAADSQLDTDSSVEA